MRRTLTLVLVLLSLAACETIKGAGRDIGNAGQALDRTF